MGVLKPSAFCTVGTLFCAIYAGTCTPIPAVPSGPDIVRPSVRSQYEVWTGAIHYNTGIGKIFKNGMSTDITTLLTFNFPAASIGKTCSFHFYLDSTATLTGSGQFDVYSSLAPATGDAASWPPGNQRNQYLGRLQAAQPNEATFVDGIPASISSFPCPSGTWAAEFVGVGDQDDIEWSGSGSSSYFTFA